MKSLYFTVIELYLNRVTQAIICKNEDIAVKKFKQIVSEYGIEADEEIINSKIFEGDDSYTIQIVQMNT